MNESMKKQITEISCRRNVLFVVAVVLILVIANVPTLYSTYPLSSDENGYIGQAALIAGYNWGGVVSQLSYYSFGNGYLLALIFRVFNDTTIIYKMILFLNSCLLIGSFYVCYKTIQLWRFDIEEEKAIIIAFVVTLYSSNFAHSNMFLAENYITFFFWLSLYCLMLFDKYKKNIYLAFMLCMAIFLFFIHQRMLGVLISAVIIVLLSKIIDKRFLKMILIMSAGVLLIMLLLRWKEYSKDMLWAIQTENAKYNDFDVYLKGGFFDNILNISSLEGIICVFIAKIWYLIVSSLSLICVAGVFLLKNIKKHFSEIELWEIYLLLSFLACLGIVVIGCYYPTRVDQIILGRYMDSIIGPYLMIGICILFDKGYSQEWKGYFQFCSFMILVTGIIVEKYACVVVQRSDVYSRYSNPTIFMFLQSDYKRGTYFAISVLFFVLLYIISCFIKNNRNWIFVFFLLLYIPNIILFHQDTIRDYKSNKVKDLMEISEHIIIDDEEQKIGYIQYNLAANQLQFLKPDVRIFPVNKYDETQNWECDFLFMQNSQISMYDIEESFKLIFQNDTYSFYSRR